VKDTPPSLQQSVTSPASSCERSSKIFQFFEPYAPAHHFEGGKNDPPFRTKLKIASELVEETLERSIPFRAVVADSFYCEDEAFKQSLSELGVGYVLALKPSHAWWHKIGEIGSPYEAALAASEAWEDARHPGDWVKVVRRFTDGHEETWWALEVDVGPYYGPERARRAVVATTDPKELPEKMTWYLVTNLPHPDSESATESELAPAYLSEIVRLYGLKVRSDIAIRRHWQLVCCAFSFCWWAYGSCRSRRRRSRRTIPTPNRPEGGKGNPQCHGRRRSER
jgi:hypothetical protein